jgi:hypothetical protein
MEQRAIVVALIHIAQEIGTGYWCFLLEEFDGEFTSGGFETQH